MKPVNEWSNRDQAFTDVAESIRKIAEVLADQMKRNEAVALLGDGFEKYTDLLATKNELNELAEILGEWPLLLTCPRRSRT